MSPRPGRILLVFLDGVGIGKSEAPSNPLVEAHLPVLRGLFGGWMPTLGGEEPAGAAALRSWVAADAQLGVPGRPQSGTGQTALLTGENAPLRFGRHFGPWVPTGLRDLLATRNLLTIAQRAGRLAAFANAHPAGDQRGRRRPAAPPLAAQAAGLLVRHEEALLAGRAIPSSLVNDAWRRHLPDLPPVTAAEAGATLARICLEADLTLFAHYDTDLVGHRRDLHAAVSVLERVDEFLGGLTASLSSDTLLVVASDHGNIEDSTTGHTTNPVPVIAAGPGAAEVVRSVRAITDVTPALLRLLNVEEPLDE